MRMRPSMMQYFMCMCVGEWSCLTSMPASLILPMSEPVVALWSACTFEGRNGAGTLRTWQVSGVPGGRLIHR